MPITLIFTLHRVDHIKNCIKVRELHLALHHTLKLHKQMKNPVDSKKEHIGMV